MYIIITLTICTNVTAHQWPYVMFATMNFEQGDRDDASLSIVKQMLCNQWLSSSVTGGTIVLS